MKKLFSFLILFLAVFSLVWFLQAGFWRVKGIDCQLNGQPCSVEIWSSLMNRVSGKNLLFLSRSKLSYEIKTQNPDFFKVGIKKLWPSRIRLLIEKRKAVMAIKSGQDYFLTDSEGYLLSLIEKKPSLPMINLKRTLALPLGEKILDPLLLAEIEILYQSQLRLQAPQFSQALSERAIEVVYENGLKVLFSPQKEVKSQLDSLQLILERTKIEGKLPAQVDLRFDKPVVSE